MKQKILPLLFSHFIFVFPAIAELRVSKIFSDEMILQQSTKNAVWGFASPGEKVTVKASWGARVTTTADELGNWKVMLPPLKPGPGIVWS